MSSGTPLTTPALTATSHTHNATASSCENLQINSEKFVTTHPQKGG
jgi:hypothetical protein